jgi:hypothetical protein
VRLVDLDPRWVGAGGEGVTRNGQPVPERHGVGLSFLCPCGDGRRRYVGFSNPLDGEPVYDDASPTWDRTGETFESLTLSPSVLAKDACKWHGYIRGGEVVEA